MVNSANHLLRAGLFLLAISAACGFSTLFADGFDDINQMEQQQALDRQATAQESQAQSQARQADALERIANGGRTNQQMQDAQRELEADQANAAMWKAEQARLARLHGPEIIKRYQAEVAGYASSRFSNWMQIQSEATLASTLNVARKTNYVDSLTKKKIAIEPDTDYSVRLRAAARDYFDRTFLAKDDLYLGWQQNVQDMRDQVVSGIMPTHIQNRVPEGMTPEQGAMWATVQWSYPGVKVLDVWQNAMDQAAKQLPAAASKADIAKAAQPIFRQIALAQLVIQPAVPSPANRWGGGK